METNTINRRNAIKRTALLMGYAVSASAIAGVLKGCKAEPPAGGLINWKPTFLSKDEGQLVAHIAECILPETDSPGAIEAGVYSFIDIHLKDNETAEAQQFFNKGLAELDKKTKDTFGKSFPDCTDDEKTEILKREEAQAFKTIEADPNAKTFWFAIKELTLLGYFTSEAGSKQFLVYDPIPGDYEGCIPLDEVGGTWFAI
jgi:gluconate 2-dehydrogenase gamma chain